MHLEAIDKLFIDNEFYDNEGSDGGLSQLKFG